MPPPDDQRPAPLPSMTRADGLADALTSQLVVAPPFAFRPDLSLAARTAAFEQTMEWLQARARPMTDVVEVLLARHPEWLPVQHGAMVDGMRSLAVGIDDGRFSHPVAYHHRLHFCEITLAAHYLGLSLALSPERLAQLVLAAIIHDLGHDGSYNGAMPFRLERASFALASPLLRQAGVDAATLDELEVLLLTTDIVNGLPYVRQWFDHHHGLCPRPQGELPDAAFAVLADAPLLTTLAIALSEADALASAGLSIETANRQEVQLAAERGWTINPRSKLAYLDGIFPDGFRVATEFNPNLEIIRAHTLATLSSQG